MSEDLQGFIITDNYWGSSSPKITEIKKERRYWGKRDGRVFYGVVVDGRYFYRIRTFMDKKTGKRVAEYAKNAKDCPDERRQPPGYRVKPHRVNLMYSEREREQKLLIHV